MIVLKLLHFHFFIADFSLLSCEFDSFKFKLLYCVIFILIKIKPLYDIYDIWRRSAVVITTAQIHSAKPKLKFCAGLNPASGMSESCDDDDL